MLSNPFGKGQPHDVRPTPSLPPNATRELGHRRHSLLATRGSAKTFARNSRNRWCGVCGVRGKNPSLLCLVFRLAQWEDQSNSSSRAGLPSRSPLRRRIASARCRTWSSCWRTRRRSTLCRSLQLRGTSASRRSAARTFDRSRNLCFARRRANTRARGHAGDLLARQLLLLRQHRHPTLPVLAVGRLYLLATTDVRHASPAGIAVSAFFVPSYFFIELRNRGEGRRAESGLRSSEALANTCMHEVVGTLFSRGPLALRENREGRAALDSFDQEAFSSHFHGIGTKSTRKSRSSSAWIDQFVSEDLMTAVC